MDPALTGYFFEFCFSKKDFFSILPGGKSFCSDSDALDSADPCLYVNPWANQSAPTSSPLWNIVKYAATEAHLSRNSYVRFLLVTLLMLQILTHNE